MEKGKVGYFIQKDMTKQEFKTNFIKNLRFYLPKEFKDVSISMRLAKKGETNLYFDTGTNSVRTVVYKEFKWRVEVRKPVFGKLFLLAWNKTVRNY